MVGAYRRSWRGRLPASPLLPVLDARRARWCRLPRASSSRRRWRWVPAHIVVVGGDRVNLVLSIFPGIDLLGRGFELAGFCIVRGPDRLWGGDIRAFHPPFGYFDGVIGGSPCQDFSRARRDPPTGYGVEMLGEFARVVSEAGPNWWLLENVPTVPDVRIEGYTVQRLDFNAREVGARQNRPRHFQFGSWSGVMLSPKRCAAVGAAEPAALATDGKRKHRRAWADFCELQGLPGDFSLPGLSVAARYAAVGNGVHVEVARALAVAIIEAHQRDEPVRLCACNCGRVVTGRQVCATAACRKRVERRKKKVV
jgi:DNA (cytosine-5)-methyltransferase 1